MGTNSNTWNDLLRQDIIFQFARFLTIDSEELRRFFIELPQSNYFNSDGEIHKTNMKPFATNVYKLFNTYFGCIKLFQKP